jgi:hypothetical protein
MMYTLENGKQKLKLAKEYYTILVNEQALFQIGKWTFILER